MVDLAAICWAIWVTRNKVTFDGYVLRTSIETMIAMLFPYVLVRASKCDDEGSCM
jgi:hypothetical protein